MQSTLFICAKANITITNFQLSLIFNYSGQNKFFIKKTRLCALSDGSLVQINLISPFGNTIYFANNYPQQLAKYHVQILTDR